MLIVLFQCLLAFVTVLAFIEFESCILMKCAYRESNTQIKRETQRERERKR